MGTTLALVEDRMAFRAELDDFGSFYERTYPAAYRTAWAILRDRGAAADAVQEAYLAAYRERARFRGDAPAQAWLLRIVVNRAISEARRRRPRLVALDGASPAAAPVDDLTLKPLSVHGLWLAVMTIPAAAPRSTTS